MQPVLLRTARPLLTRGYSVRSLSISLSLSGTHKHRSSSQAGIDRYAIKATSITGSRNRKCWASMTHTRGSRY